MRKRSTALLIAISTMTFFGCNSSTENKKGAQATAEETADVIYKPFTEGIVEMGMYSEDKDLGSIIAKIDYTKPNVKQQFEGLALNDADAKGILDMVKQAGEQNPIAAMAMTLNIAECTYYIKDDAVLGKARGMGWIMDNLHDKGQDRGSLYLETLVQTEQIADQDKKIFVAYSPSKNAGAGAMNNIDFSQYDREEQEDKEIVSDYECDVIVYTPKNAGPSTVAQLHKLIVYTSPLFNNTINFTHPYYLKEEGGILRLDIYLMDVTKPTLVMKPKSIKAQEIPEQELKTRTAAPAYVYTDPNWAFKSLAIMMAGWAAMAQ